MRTAILLVWLCCLPLQAVATVPTLEEISALARGGAPALALRLMDRVQADPGDNPATWADFERERLHILAARGAWHAMVTRIDAHPEGLPDAFVIWALERKVEAHLQTGDTHAALDDLRALIWRHEAPDPDILKVWRRLIVRTHLEAGEITAALTALQRYTQDYGHEDPGLKGLHAEALLAAGRVEEAAALLQGEDEVPTRALRWYAELLAGRVAANETFERAVRSGSARDTPPLMRKAAWRVAAEAARRMGNSAAELAAMERALVTDGGNRALPAPLVVSAHEIWESYRRWGRTLGNERQLIVGVDAQWLEAAEATDDPLMKRAFYASVAHDTRSPAVAENAHFHFTRTLMTEPGGARLLTALYLDPAVFPDPGDLPPTVRQVLIDPVLADGDITLASALIADLGTPPVGTDAAEWSLRRARVLVLGGQMEHGVTVLHELLDQGQVVDTDRLLQVVFDLQAVEAHEQALSVFDRLYASDTLAPQSRRELLYWMADSHRAMQHHDEAARLYLRSATLLEAFAIDPWAQTARYQAAESLASAGLNEDAIVSLRTLMNATEDMARQAVLRHRIEQLRRVEVEESP